MMLKHAVPLFVVWIGAIIVFSSISNLSSTAVSATTTESSLRTRDGNSIKAPDFLLIGQNSTSCSDLTTCKNCTNTYTCHWCEKTETCHARGSIHGCAWGDTCKDVDPPKKKNNTCASQTTCSDCAKVSHFCHWCEHDNACHAMGSRFGCTIGVDCYSNDRCRRSEPEPFPKPSSPIQAVGDAFRRVPLVVTIVIGFSALVWFGCLSCCFCFVSNFKGAYDDLADLTIAASVAPMSVIGDARFVRFSEFPDDEVIAETIPEEENQSNSDVDTDADADANSSNENNTSGDNTNNNDEANIEQSPQTPQECEEVPLTTADTQNDTNEQQEETIEEGGTSYYLMNASPNPRENEARPLLHPSFSGSTGGFEEPRHMKRLFKYCSALYYISLAMLLLFIGLSFFFYPTMPLYNICNDEVAWEGIMKNIVAFKFDASFEVLGSLSNQNHIGAALDRGKGSFAFQGKQFGTFEVPPVTAEAMSITDFMIIVHISPEDKAQVMQLAEAYYSGKLVLEAEFQGRIRIPALFDYTRDIDTNNIPIDITGASDAASDRSLCHCPTWDDDKNHSTPSLEQHLGLEAFL